LHRLDASASPATTADLAEQPFAYGVVSSTLKKE
jgi:hypothetical protein